MTKALNASAGLAQQPARSNQSIEALRILGAIGIVWFHLQLPMAWAAYAALHVFVIWAVYFGARFPIRRQFIRFMLPWFFWSAVYGAAKIAQAIKEGISLGEEFSLWMLFTGPSIHLWFLPFCFVALVLAHKARSLPSWLAPLFMVISVILAALAPNHVPFTQWSHVLPAAALGYWMFRSDDPRMPLSLSASFALLLYLGGFGHGSEQIALAAVACLAAQLFRLPAYPVIGMLAPLSFGIYLIHPLVIALLMVGGITSPWALFALALPLSAALSACVKRFGPRPPVV